MKLSLQKEYLSEDLVVRVISFECFDDILVSSSTGSASKCLHKLLHSCLPLCGEHVMQRSGFVVVSQPWVDQSSLFCVREQPNFTQVRVDFRHVDIPHKDYCMSVVDQCYALLMIRIGRCY